MAVNKAYFILSFIMISSLAFGQELEMSLMEVKEHIILKNIDLRIAENDLTLQESDYLQSRAMYYPNVSLNYTGITTSSPLMAFGSKLNQSIVTQNDFNPALLNDPDGLENFSFQLKVKQPILNFDKKHQRQAAKLGMDATLMKTQRTKEYLGFAAEQTYMQLQLAYEAQEVLDQALEIANINLRHAKNSFDVGYLQKVDLLEIDVHINELKNKKLNTENQIKDISDQLHTLMQDKDYTVIKPSEKLQLTRRNINNELDNNRSDFKAMELANKAYSEMLEAEKKSILPRLNAFATFETNDSSPLATSAGNYLIGAQISWNLFDGMQRKAKIQRAKAQLEKGQLERQKYMNQNRADLNKSVRMYNQALVKLETVKLALEQAEESLRIRTNRFEQGLEKASDVLHAETTFSEIKLQELQTILEINMASLYAQFLSASNIK